MTIIITSLYSRNILKTDGKYKEDWFFNVPNLRFGTSEGKVLPLSQLIKIKMGQSPDSSSYNELGIGLPLVQGNNDIKDGFSFSQRYTSSLTKVCEKGDVLLTVRAPVGCVAIANEKICIGRGICSTRSSKYFYYLFQSKKKEFNKLAQGSTFTCISSDDIYSLKCFKTNDEEMTKITNFLDLIEERVRTQNKIIEKVDSLIKSICSSTNDEKSIPLDYICTYHLSSLKETGIDNKGMFPVYGANGICGYSSTYQFETIGIVIVKDGASVGRCIKIKDEKYSILGTMALLTPKEDVNIDFLWMIICGINFNKYIVGSGIPHIYFKNYKKELVCQINKKTMTKALICRSLDNKKGNEQKLLTKYQNMKTFLLNNMFI